MATPEELSWRKSIVSQLQERNKLQTRCFEEIIAQNNKLFDNANTLRSENLQLSILNERLKVGSELSGTGASGAASSKFAERIQLLEQKLLAQQEELTELHRRKGENVQKIIDLNVKLQEKEKVLAAKETSLDAAMVTNGSLRTEIQVYENSLKELQDQNQMLKDEHQALQLLFASLEEKLRKVQDENRELVERLISFKAKDADKMNEENDNFIKKRNAKMQKELEEACRDTRGLSPDDVRDTGGPMFHCSTLPTSATVKFDAHDGEVNAVKWSPVDKLLATGGADRKVKLWDVSKGTAESRGVLQGSNKGVMSVDFDMSGALILGASNDMASRVWSVADQRLKHTLTGHSEKVMAAKFLGERSKVVSGSYDRTLKIWDIRGGACIETKFAGSKCNDLVTADCAGSTIISCHFDKKIRFWDIRMDSRANDIELKGRVTSLDLTKDGKYLLSCDRDDTLKLLDLRKNEIVQTFTCDDFKVGCDWARATFSPDGQYVAAGSADGSVFVWGVMSAKLEAVLKEHTSATTATAWSPYTSYLASVDRSKKAIIWGH